MPQPNQDAATAGVISEQAPAVSESTAVEQTTETQSTSVMDALGVPAEVQAELKAKQAPAETETPKEETPAAEAESEIESSATTQEENPTEEQHETHGDWPESAKKRLAKERSKRGKIEEKAEALEAEVEQLRAALESTQPVTVAPTNANPLAHIQDEQQLGQVVAEAKVTRDWCRKNLNGFTADEGKETERFISPEEIADTLGKAEDILTEGVPRKRAEFQQRAHFNEVAKQKYPTLFDKGSEDYQKLAFVFRRFPMLATDPAGILMAGHYLRGAKASLEEEMAAGKNGKGADIPAALNRAIPPIAPHVPAARGSNDAQPSRKRVETEMNHVIQDGGGRDSIARALDAMDEARSKTNGSRSLVSV